jgi:acid stress-induced BolA-like protein IbaG/YrbA
MEKARKAILKALGDGLPGCDVVVEPFSGEKFALTVLWDGFADQSELERQHKVRETVQAKLGAAAEEALEHLAFVFVWTPKEKRQYDIDKL